MPSTNHYRINWRSRLEALRQTVPGATRAHNTARRVRGGTHRAVSNRAEPHSNCTGCTQCTAVSTASGFQVVNFRVEGVRPPPTVIFEHGPLKRARALAFLSLARAPVPRAPRFASHCAGTCARAQSGAAGKGGAGAKGGAGGKGGDKKAAKFELTEEQKQEIREAFDLFDTDGSGA